MRGCRNRKPVRYLVPMMKSSLDHIPHRKQRELARALEILHEEFEDALGEGTADFKKRGRILKIILFGSYARGTFVDEPHTMKGYRSDFDLLVIVNNRKLTDHATYWYKAADRIIRDSFIETPTQFIVHSLREVNTELQKGHYFFSDIRKEGIVLYELDDEPLAEPKHKLLGERNMTYARIFPQIAAISALSVTFTDEQLARPSVHLAPLAPHVLR